MALIFVGVFLAATLFTFFWVDEFFARGIADLRPMFRWMPTLMIFLAAALTMRQWSEEQQTGTLEMLFTMPMKLYQLVLGKFLAALILVAVALAADAFPADFGRVVRQPRFRPDRRRLPGDAAAGFGLYRHRPVHLLAHRPTRSSR